MVELKIHQMRCIITITFPSLYNSEPINSLELFMSDLQKIESRLFDYRQ